MTLHQGRSGETLTEVLGSAIDAEVTDSGVVEKSGKPIVVPAKVEICV